MFMKIIPFLFILCFAFFAEAEFKQLQFSEDWKKCSTDTDCAIGRNACNSIDSYNKNYLKEVREFNDASRSLIDCMERNDKDFDNARATCVEQVCGFILPTQ